MTKSKDPAVEEAPAARAVVYLASLVPKQAVLYVTEASPQAAVKAPLPRACAPCSIAEGGIASSARLAGFAVEDNL